MNTLISLHNSIFAKLEISLAPWLLPTLARFAFAAVLLRYFWNSAWLKLDDGKWHIFPDDGAYIQVLPQKIEAIGYDFSLLTPIDTLIVTLGTWAEVILPLLIVIGLFTRLAAFGMIGFVLVQSIVDVTGHHADAATIGAWFDTASGSLLMDQRLLWVTLFVTLVLRGAGPISVDRLLR